MREAPDWLTRCIAQGTYWLKVRSYMLLHISRIGIQGIEMTGDLVDISMRLLMRLPMRSELTLTWYAALKSVMVRSMLSEATHQGNRIGENAAQKAGCPLMVHINHYRGYELVRFSTFSNQVILSLTATMIIQPQNYWSGWCHTQGCRESPSTGIIFDVVMAKEASDLQ